MDILQSLLKKLRGTEKVQLEQTGYCVSTVGLDEEMIKKYIREQDNSDTE